MYFGWRNDAVHRQKTLITCLFGKKLLNLRPQNKE